jgi:hypothetical protein
MRIWSFAVQSSGAKNTKYFLPGMEAAAPKAVMGRRCAEKAKGVYYDY